MLNKLYDACNDRVQLYSAPYVEYSIFYILFSIFPYILWKEDNSHISFLLKFIGGSLCSILLIKEAWPDKYKKYFDLYWYITLWFCLPFTNVLILINNGFADWSLINTAFSIFVLAALVDWLLFILLFVSGIISALCYSILFKAELILNFDLISSDQFVWAIYILIFSVTTSFLFVRRRENLNSIRIEVARNLSGVLCHEIRNPLGTLILANQNFKNSIVCLVEKTASEHFTKKIDIIIEDLNFLIEDVLIKVQEHNFIPLETLSIKSEIYSCIKDYPFKGNERDMIDIAIENDFIFLGDSRLFKYVIFNLIKNSVYHIKSKELGKILIYTNNHNDEKILIFEDNGPGIDAADLLYLFNSFFTKRPNGVGLGLFFCKKVIKKFGGDISCESQQGKYTRFRINFIK